MKNDIIKYLVLDTETNLLSIQEVNWAKFNFVNDTNSFNPLDSIDKDFASKEFLKIEIHKSIPNGVIVARQHLSKYFVKYEWDALNLLKFEIDSNFEDKPYLELRIYPRPFVEQLIKGLGIVFEKAVNFDKNISFEPSTLGWDKLFECAVKTHNEFVEVLNPENYDNTPYYNIEIDWSN